MCGCRLLKADRMCAYVEGSLQTRNKLPLTKTLKLLNQISIYKIPVYNDTKLISPVYDVITEFNCVLKVDSIDQIFARYSFLYETFELL